MLTLRLLVKNDNQLMGLVVIVDSSRACVFFFGIVLLIFWIRKFVVRGFFHYNEEDWVLASNKAMNLSTLEVLLL